MRRQAIFLGLAAVLALRLSGAPAEEDFGFLSSSEWFIDSEIYSREPQQAFFRTNDLKKETILYRRQISLGTFYLYYPISKEMMVMVGRDYNNDGSDDALNIKTKDNNSYFMLVQPEDPFLLLAGGTRKGPVTDPGHPFVGTWVRGGGKISSEVRLVKPDAYRFFMRLTEIRGYGIRDGWYLLKHSGGNVFETDDTFPDGRLRLEVRSRTEIVLTPLFTLPASEGIVAPVLLRARE